MNVLLRRRAPLLALVITCAVCGSWSLAAESVRHRVHIEGEGTPTVIFEAGLGDTLDVWRNVQPQTAAHCARTLTYNRAGYPGSDPAIGPRDAATIVAELRSELSRQGLRPPYVLVGHSLGGLYMQYFARRHPGEVAGLVLVDSTHWNQGLPLENRAGRPTHDDRRSVVLFMSWIMRREIQDSARAGEQVRASPPAPKVPTIVLSSTRAFRGETPASRTAAARMQEEIAAEFSAARHVRVDGSGHYIQNDRPDVVINAARALAGCDPWVESHPAP